MPYIFTPVNLIDDANCTESGSVQLTGGATDSEGVLQYCYKGAWVQFCLLGDAEATVACKQLGFQPLASKSIKV